MSENANLPAIPDYLKKYIAPANAPSNDADSMASSSMSIPRISLKAKKFRWIENGEEVKAEAETHVVILAVEPGAGKFVKTYYDGPYNPGDTSPPTCSSSDGVRPDSWVTTPQNELCATCPNNVFGSATSLKGKKAKKCRDSKRLWVVPPDDIKGTVFGLNIPVTSLKGLSEFGQKLKDTGAPISAAVVKLGMFEDESYPIIVFELAGWLKEEHAAEAINRNTEKDWSGVLKAPNPPVQIAMKPAAAAITSQPQTAQEQPKAIEGEVVPTKNASVDEVLKTWG